MKLNQKGALDITVAIAILLVTALAAFTVLSITSSNDEDTQQSSSETSNSTNSEGTVSGLESLLNKKPASNEESVNLQNDLADIESEDVEALNLEQRDDLRRTIANVYVYELARFNADNGSYPEFPDFDDVFEGPYLDEDYNEAFSQSGIGATSNFENNEFVCPEMSADRLSFFIDRAEDGSSYDLYNCLEAGESYQVLL